jgi:hypothetical protein
MENKGKINPTDLKIQGLLDRYLRVRSANNSFENGQAHLDEDSLAAFVEGNLTRREAQPMVNHMVDCSFCRNITAELVRMDLAFAENVQPVAAVASQPTKVSEVLSGILSRIFGTSDGAVFAHHEEDSKEEKKEENK